MTFHKFHAQLANEPTQRGRLLGVNSRANGEGVLRLLPLSVSQKISDAYATRIRVLTDLMNLRSPTSARVNVERCTLHSVQTKQVPIYVRIHEKQ